MNCLTSIRLSAESFSDSCKEAAQNLKDRIIQVKKTVTSNAASAKETIAQKIRTDQGIIRFIRVNWKHLIAYTIAWGIIILGLGGLYGFKATALPLTIGYGAGTGIGILAGIIVAAADKKNKLDGVNTLWGLLNKGFNSLDANGTRAIVVSVSISVMMAVASVFPHALGGVFGLMVGNHLMTKICYNVKKSFDPNMEIEGHLDLGTPGKNPQLVSKKITSAEQKLEKAREQLKKLQEQLDGAQKLIEELKSPPTDESAT